MYNSFLVQHNLRMSDKMDVNVTVAVRCRDLIRSELANNCAGVVNVNENKIIVKLDGEEGNKEFSFDHCFGTDSLNLHIFNELVEPLIIKALDGFNATVVAYGQTSAGKTHTLHGIFDEIDTHRGYPDR